MKEWGLQGCRKQANINRYRALLACSHSLSKSLSPSGPLLAANLSATARAILVTCARSLICHPSQRASTRRRVPHCWLGCMDPGHAPGAGTLLLLSGRHFLGHSSVSRQIQIQPTTTLTTTHATYKGGAAILSIVRWAALRAIGLCWEDSLYRLFGPQVSSGLPCKSDKTLHADADRPVFPLCK